MTIFLNDWAVVTKPSPYTAPELQIRRLTGKVYNHHNPHLQDGEMVTTSKIVSVYENKVETKSGSVYVLGEPCADYEAEFPNARERVLAMSNTVKVMMGYTVSNNNNIQWEDVEFVAEVQTDGTDTNGYQFQETLGVARDEYNQLCLFKGSTDRDTYEKCSAIFMSNNGIKLSEVLRMLSIELERLGE